MACVTRRKASGILRGNLKERQNFEKPSNTREDNIKNDLQERKWVADWIYLAQNREKWRISYKTMLMILIFFNISGIYLKAENLLASQDRLCYICLVSQSCSHAVTKLLEFMESEILCRDLPS